MRLVSLLLNNKPIRKVAVAALVSALLYLAHHVLHVQVASDEVRPLVEAALPIIAAYLTPDPRVDSE